MFKRLFDIILALLGLIILSPLGLVICGAILLTSRGSLLYRGARIGQHGKPFKIFKFRSMVTNADKQGPKITAASDPRITSVGRFLRKTKLDELPQLLNVVRGEMSIVGPRPEDPQYVVLYTPEQRRILDVKPGITSLASLKYRNEEGKLTGPDWEILYVQKIMPEKLSIDLNYITQANILTDIRVIIRTFLAVIGLK